MAENKLENKSDQAVRVKVKGPGSIYYGSSREAKSGEEALLTAAEYESVKSLVVKL